MAPALPKHITVGDLRKMIAEIPDDTPVLRAVGIGGALAEEARVVRVTRMQNTEDWFKESSRGSLTALRIG